MRAAAPIRHRGTAPGNAGTCQAECKTRRYRRGCESLEGRALLSGTKRAATCSAGFGGRPGHHLQHRSRRRGLGIRDSTTWNGRPSTPGWGGVGERRISRGGAGDLGSSADIQNPPMAESFCIPSTRPARCKAIRGSGHPVRGLHLLERGNAAESILPPPARTYRRGQQ